MRWQFFGRFACSDDKNSKHLLSWPTKNPIKIQCHRSSATRWKIIRNKKNGAKQKIFCQTKTCHILNRINATSGTPRMSEEFVGFKLTVHETIKAVKPDWNAVKTQMKPGSKIWFKHRLHKEDFSISCHGLRCCKLSLNFQVSVDFFTFYPWKFFLDFAVHLCPIQKISHPRDCVLIGCKMFSWNETNS